jgi:hypothetical protein
MDDKQRFREFAEWFEYYKHDLPEGFTDEMSVHAAQELYFKLKEEDKLNDRP